MSDGAASGVDFAKRVQHFDIAESDRSDDDGDDDGGSAGGGSGNGVGGGGVYAKAKRTDDIEKEYLIGGRTSFGDDEDADAAGVDARNGCCAGSCGGNEKAGRVEGRTVVLIATIVSMALGALLLYASWDQFRAPNRRIVTICGFALGALTEVSAALGLIGLCRFSDTSKAMFKLAFWVNLIQYWAFATYFTFLLFVWDGNFTHGTAPLSPAAPATAAPVTATGAALLELSVGVSTETAAEAIAQAPTTVSGRSAAEEWRALQRTQIWFLGLVLGQLLCSVLYVYGSLRLRCKQMGKWGTAITGFLLIAVALATLAFAAFTIRYNTQLITPVGLSPIVAQMAVAVLIAATVIYEWVVSTRVAKQKLAAKPSFVALQAMAWTAFVAVGVCHYTYYQSLHTTPRIDLLHLTALAGTLSQVLLLVFAVQLVAWQYALPEEYPALPAVEKFGPSGAFDETDPFVPPPREPLEI